MATINMPAPEKNFDTADPLPSEEYVEKAMPSILGSFDMTVVYVMIIFFITNATTAIAGGAATSTKVRSITGRIRRLVGIGVSSLPSAPGFPVYC